MGSYHLMGTGFCPGTMKKFWRGMGLWSPNNVNVLNATEPNTEKWKWKIQILSYAYLTTS